MQIKSVINKLKSSPFFIQSINTIILRIIGVITLFGFTLFLTHNYSPIIIGQYDFIRTFLLVVGSLCLLGTDQSILYFAGIINGNGNNKDLIKVYYDKITLVFFTSLVPFIVLLLIGEERVSNFFNDMLIYSLIIKTSAVLFFYCVTILNTETFRALNKIYTAELFRNTFKYLSVIIGAIYLFYTHQEQYLVDVFLLGFIILAFISFFLIFLFFKKLENNNHLKSVVISHKEIVVKSFPMAVSGMAFFLLMSFDIMFLKKYFGNEQVAYYSTAIKLMTILSLVIISVNITASTKIAEFHASNNIIELKKTVKNTSRLIFIFTFPTAIIISVFSNSILAIFGAGYNIASNALIILMLGQAVCSLFGSAPIYLNMTGRQKTFQNILIIAVIINFITNSLLVPKYGMIGASISFVISLFFWNIITALIIYKRDRVNILFS
ncbi:polysaccharide biosynthesis C-terminal domain-containing protein [Flavobacterium sp.]|jgi:O-antigen/teichoic acid export membrane protein|uniref:MATE family efflux transporter n=1 Tax=Flavobacterium sp. TaxID=239 RepID=UPI0037BE9816